METIQDYATQCLYVGIDPKGYCRTHRSYDCSVYREIETLKKALGLACEWLTLSQEQRAKYTPEYFIKQAQKRS